MVLVQYIRLGSFRDPTQNGLVSYSDNCKSDASVASECLLMYSKAVGALLLHPPAHLRVQKNKYNNSSSRRSRKDVYLIPCSYHIDRELYIEGYDI